MEFPFTRLLLGSMFASNSNSPLGQEYQNDVDFFDQDNILPQESEERLVPYAAGSAMKIKGSNVEYRFISYTKNREVILANNNTNELVWIDIENLVPVID